MSENRLQGKKALVTGASRGLGLAIAQAFAAQGADVVMTGRKEATLEEAVKSVTGSGKVFPVACHSGKVDEVNQLVEKAVAELGGLDILVNNAATNPVFGPAMFVEEWAWDKIMDVNLKGYFFTAKACLPHLQQSMGNIINVASVAGLSYAQGMGVYSISKAGVLMLTKTLASEWGAFGIRVNAIAPGLFKTKFSQALWSTDDILKQVIATQALDKLAEPEDIVGAVLFLAGADAGFVTGQTLVVDGGSYT